MIPTFIGSYFGISRRHELITWIIISIVKNYWSESPLEFRHNVKQIWNMRLDNNVFSENVQNYLKRLLSGIVMIRSVTAQLYLLSSLVLLWPLFFEDKPALCYPWLLISGLKNLGTSLVSFVAGLFICGSYGACRAACLIFSLGQLWTIVPALYMWINIHYICQGLKKASVVVPKVPRQIEQLETMTAVRRRMVRSMSTRAAFNNDIENRPNEGNSALGLEDIFKTEGCQSLDKGTKSLDTLLEDMANADFNDNEEENEVIIEKGLKPSQITMKLLGITQSQIEAARMSRNIDARFSHTGHPKLKLRYPKSMHLSQTTNQPDKSSPSTSTGIKSKMYYQSSMNYMAPKIIRKTKSEDKVKLQCPPPEFLTDVAEIEIKTLSMVNDKLTHDSSDEEEDTETTESKKKFNETRLSKPISNKSIVDLYSFKKVNSPTKLVKLKEFLQAPLQNYRLMSKIKSEFIEKLFVDNNSGLQNTQNYIQNKHMSNAKKTNYNFQTLFDSKACTNLSIDNNDKISISLHFIKSGKVCKPVKPYKSHLSISCELKQVSDESKVESSEVCLSERASDSLLPRNNIEMSFLFKQMKKYFEQTKENKIQIDKLEKRMKDAVNLRKNVEEAKGLLEKVSDLTVRDLCCKLLDTIGNVEANGTEIEINSYKCLKSVTKFIKEHINEEECKSCSLENLFKNVSQRKITEKQQNTSGDEYEKIKIKRVGNYYQSEKYERVFYDKSMEIKKTKQKTFLMPVENHNQNEMKIKFNEVLKQYLKHQNGPNDNLKVMENNNKICRSKIKSKLPTLSQKSPNLSQKYYLKNTTKDQNKQLKLHYSNYCSQTPWNSEMNNQKTTIPPFICMSVNSTAYSKTTPRSEVRINKFRTYPKLYTCLTESKDNYKFNSNVNEIYCTSISNLNRKKRKSESYWLIYTKKKKLLEDKTEDYKSS